MLIKKLIIASTILAASTTVAFADTTTGEDYKDEAAPCPVYQFQAGPYLGLSVGPRINFASSGGPATYAGAEGTLSGGYASMINPDFYLAGELFIGDSLNIKDYPAIFNGPSVRSTWSYGLDIIPGYMLTDHFLGYLRTGIVRTHFSNVNSSATGWQLGVGGQTNIYQNWDFRTEYVYSSYSSTNSITPQGGVFNIGIVYKFV